MLSLWTLCDTRNCFTQSSAKSQLTFLTPEAIKTPHNVKIVWVSLFVRRICNNFAIKVRLDSMTTASQQTICIPISSSQGVSKSWTTSFTILWRACARCIRNTPRRKTAMDVLASLPIKRSLTRYGCWLMVSFRILQLITCKYQSLWLESASKGWSTLYLNVLEQNNCAISCFRSETDSNPLRASGFPRMSWQ